MPPLFRPRARHGRRHSNLPPRPRCLWPVLEHLTVSGTIDHLISTSGIEQIYAATSDGHRAARHLEHIRATGVRVRPENRGSVANSWRYRPPPRRADETEPSLPTMTATPSASSPYTRERPRVETVILPDLGFKSEARAAAFHRRRTEQRGDDRTRPSLSAHYRPPGRETSQNILDEREEAEMRRSSMSP